MTRPRDPKAIVGYGCTPCGRCYQWEYNPKTQLFFFRGPGLSQNHQPGKRHPARQMAEAWRASHVGK